MKIFKSLSKTMRNLRSSKDKDLDPTLLTLLETIQKPKRHFSLKFDSSSHQKTENTTLNSTKPKDHNETFEKIKGMRKDRTAPVDLLGSHLQLVHQAEPTLAYSSKQMQIPEACVGPMKVRSRKCQQHG